MVEPLTIYTIYKNTKDYPGHFVCRRFEITSEIVPLELIGISQGLKGIRKHLPMGLHRLERNPNDDPNIVEVWL